MNHEAFAGQHEDTPVAIFERYSKRLIRFAERRLSKQLAGRVDGEDVVQSAFRTFFRRREEGSLKIDGNNQLWRLLVCLTLRKAMAKGRFHTAAKRDVALEISAEQAPQAFLAREPAPEDGVFLADHIECLLAGLPAVHGEILRQRLEGASVKEISMALNLSRQTIYRALHLLQSRLEKEADSDSVDTSP
ncbi:RNA polymerase sigma factor [Lignipirellula cremea]|uniref:RNA polymerase sigma factor n=1 Tax=Lignipirellula cremea TaxID=2528010 RepID=A0A518E255_9BACT|nr:sigma-70 family RNA polymerase sigma factor [Lignipirellula cremea]QDU98161.1 RNA polymerase sigma factor [Lignipirellula cremea]